MNTLKIFLLMTFLTVLLVAVGGAIGGQRGAMFALILAGGMNLFTYFFSDRMVLAMYGARVVSESEAPELYGVVRSLAERAGIPMPKVAIIPQEAPNAFATGRDPQHAVVAATEGFLRMVDRDELEGVLAHEIGHVVGRDILLGAITATLAGALSMLARFAFWGGLGHRDDREGGGVNPIFAILGIIAAPIAAMIVQAMISRQKEYRADESGAKLSGKPLALASALTKLERWSRRVPLEGAPATAHLFIVNPFETLTKLFSTHPPTEDRVARLQQMAYGGIRPR
jgi:heat shock protein HtpX